MVKSGPEHMYPSSVGAFVTKEKLKLFGKEIGRCPRALADIIAPLFDQYKIVQGRSICTGKRCFLGNGPGGGMHLECMYLFQTKDKEIAEELRRLLADNSFAAFVLNS